ncbi:unnamed protein product [Closterium sp. NIES-53]
MHNGASRANRLRASASVRTAVFYRATLDSHSAAALAHCRPAVLAGHLSAVLTWLLYATLAGAVIVTMVGPVPNASVADTLEARLADARKRHADGEYGMIPLLIVELGIQSQWATEYPSCPVSPRPVRNEGGVDDEVNGGARVSGNDGMKQRGVIKVDGGVDRSQARVQRSTAAAGNSQPRLEVAGLKGFADGTVPIPPVDDVGLRGEFRVAHLLTFMVISRCCSPVVQLALKSCRERLDAGHQAWHFILSTYQVRDELYIAQLEEKMTHIRMGEQESATYYCNRARRILAEMQMAGAEYSTASYISHIIKGLPRRFNLMKRMMMVPGTRESLDKDSITSYILQDEQQGQRRKPSGGGSGSGRSTKDINERRSTRDKGRGGGGRRRECWICHDPDHLSYKCPDRDDSDEDDTKGGRSRSTSRHPHSDARPHKEKQTSRKTSSTKDVDNSSSKSRGDGEASCSMVGVVEPTVSLAPEGGEDFQAVAAAVQANPMAVLLDSGCSHHLMGTKAVFVDMAPSDGVKHVRGFNGTLQPVEGRGNIALQGEAGKWVLILDVLYVPGVQANLLSAGQLKESGVQLKGNGDEMLLIATTGGVLGRARYTGRVLCTNLRPFSTRSQSTEEALAVVHIDLCGPFRVAAKDGSLYFLLLKDRHTRFVWVMLVAKKSDVLREFQKWLVLVERQAKKPLLMLRSDQGGEFLRKEFTTFVNGKGIVHDLTCPNTPQQNGMAEREMCTAVESVRTMLLHMGVQHHWWHLALRQAVWVRNCLERSTTPPGTTPYQLLTGKKPDLTLARVWGCMVQFMVPEQQRGGKLAPKARWGLHLGVSPASKGWEVLNLTDDKVVTSVEVIFYETVSLEVWKATFGPASGQTQAHPPTNPTTATIPLLTKVDEPADEDVVEVLPPPPVLAPPFPVADRPASTPVSATGDEGSLEASPVAPAKGELSAGEDSTDSDVVEVPITKPELRRTGRARRPPERMSFHTCLPPAAFTTEYDKVNDDLLYDDAKEDEKLPDEGGAGEFDDDPLYDDAEEDEALPELEPNMHADPEHRWDIATMTVKEALTSWKGEAVKAAMEEEIRSLVGMGTWELVERPRGVNIMKNRWVLTTKYRIDDTVERKKARLVVKGFTQVCGANYDKTYSPVSSYVTLRIILCIVAVLDLNLMQLDMKNAFLQSKLDRVLYMYQPDYFDDGIGRVCRLLKSLYGLKQSPLLWYRALDGVFLDAGWKKSQVDEALYVRFI